MVDEQTAPPKFTLDDLLAQFDNDPTLWKPALYVSHPQRTPTGGIMRSAAGESAGPITGLTSPVDLEYVWRELVARLGDAGDLVCRLLPAAGKEGKSLTVAVPITAAAVARWGAPAAPPRAPPPAMAQQQQSPAYAAPAAPPQVLPPPDLVSALILGQQQAQQQTQQMLNTLLSTITTRPQDPYMATLIQENKTLQDRLNTALKEPAKMEKTEFKEALEFGKELAGKESSGMALLAGPVTSLANSIEKAADRKGEIELKKASADEMRADSDLTEKRIKLLELQLSAHAKGLVELAPEDLAKATAALAEVDAARAAAAVDAAKAKTANN